MYFGDSVRRTKNYLRIIIILVPSALILSIQIEINILFRLLELLILSVYLSASANVLFHNKFTICFSPILEFSTIFPMLYLQKEYLPHSFV